MIELLNRIEYNSFCLHDAKVNRIEFEGDCLLLYLSGIFIEGTITGEEQYIQDIAIKYSECDIANNFVYITYRYGIRNFFYLRSERIIEFSSFMKKINEKEWTFEIIDDFYNHSCNQKESLLIGAIYDKKKYIEARIEICFERMTIVDVI